jgi:hypothetical protein
MTGPDCEACWGGFKGPEVEVWAAAFNNVDWSVLFRFLESPEWEYPHEVQVFIRTQGSPKFGLFELQAGRLVPVNAEAAVQIATMGTDYKVDADGNKYPFAVGRHEMPRTAAEVDGLVEEVAAIVHRPRQAIADEVRRLLD